MKLRKSRAAKLIAGILFAVLLLLAAASGFGILAFTETGVYTDGGIRLREDIAESLFHTKTGLCYDFACRLIADDLTESQRRSYEKQLAEDSTNLSITIRDTLHDEILYRNFEAGGDYQYRFHSTARLWVSRTDSAHSGMYADTTAVQDGPAPGRDGEVAELEIVAYLKSDLSAKDAFSRILPLLDTLIAMRHALFWIIGAALCAALALLIFLIAAAGYDAGCEGIRLRFPDRVPLDVLIAVYFFAGGVIIALADALNYHNDAAVLLYFLFAGTVLIALLISLLLTVAVRIRAGTLLGNTLIRRILCLLGQGCRFVGRAVISLPLWWMAGLGFLALSLVELLFLACDYEAAVIGWLLSRPIYLAALIYLVLMLRRLEKAGAALASGDTECRADTKWMLPALARHGENLGRMSEGLASAVEARMRSERMKSELVTNVSHDIKTPLTSIINYIDLLKTAGLDSPDAPQYLEVLEHQSQRLRKLTEDLIEASKASSGTLAVDPEPTDVNVLLTQALGEYEEPLTAAHITPTLRLTEENPIILADGRLLWRVFDNLFSNIRKYALPGTRAYITSAVEAGRAVITFRNISAEELTADGTELSERFVRGDASRHTEGSGLGLSIARSLTELMGGRFTVTVDGDLFKVTVDFGLHGV